MTATHFDSQLLLRRKPTSDYSRPAWTAELRRLEAAILRLSSLPRS